MSASQLAILETFAGLRPSLIAVGRVRAQMPRVKAFLNALAICILIFLLRDVPPARGGLPTPRWALIGRQWVTLADKDGQRRIDDPDDLVRFEVRTALERGVQVIPVLVDGAELRLSRVQGLHYLVWRAGRQDPGWEGHGAAATRRLRGTQRAPSR